MTLIIRDLPTSFSLWLSSDLLLSLLTDGIYFYYRQTESRKMNEQSVDFVWKEFHFWCSRKDYLEVIYYNLIVF